MVAQAYTKNKPLLASKQMIDDVFRLYKVQIHTEIQTKFDNLIAEKESSQAEELKREGAERVAEKAKDEAALIEARKKALAAESAVTQAQKEAKTLKTSLE